MPDNDGTGPRGQGPMTGSGKGFCIITTDSEKPGGITGFAGVDGKPIEKLTKNNVTADAFQVTADKKEVIKMPGGDGTGPGGMGPMTGRSAGYCAGYSMQGFTNSVGGRGLGFGRGRGFGRGLGLGFRGGRGDGYGVAPYGAPYGYGALPVPYGTMTGVPYGVVPTSQQELDALKGQSEYMEDALEGIRKHIAELETKEKK